MKTHHINSFKTLVFIALFFALSKKIHSQAYIPMLNGYAEWHVTNCYFGCATDNYFTIGDTVINSLHYTFLDRYHYNKNFVIREDTSTRKVYMRMLSDTGHAKEYLLYDFAARVNDTVSIQNPGSPFPKYAGSFVVDSIRPKMLLTMSHRFFYLHSLDTIQSITKNTIWVEGIGSLCLINTPGALPQINGVGQLSCFFSNGMHEYQQLDSISNCIQVYPMTVKEQQAAGNFRITQDFDTQSVSIYALKNERDITLSIYSMEGKLLFYRNNITTPVTELYIGKYTKGLLLLKLETGNTDYNTYKIFNP